MDPVIPVRQPPGSSPSPSDAGAAGTHPLTAADSHGDRPGSAELQTLAALAERLRDDPSELLDLLRRLEQLHRAIQDGPFRDSLPGDRNRLFRLLATMEDSGGWPYIPRLQLRTFMELLQREPPLDPKPSAPDQLAA